MDRPMRVSSASLLRCAVLAACICAPFALAQSRPRPRPIGPTNNILAQRAEWFRHQRAFPLEDIPVEAWQQAVEQTRRHQARAPQAAQIALNPFWFGVGPAPILNGQNAGNFPVSGRVTTIAVDPSNASHWLIG